MIGLVFFESSKRLGKTYLDNEVRPYPNVKALTSHRYEHEANAAGLRQRFEWIKAHAERGHALFRGELQRPLVNESRKGLTDTKAQAHTLVLDIDGFHIDGLAFPEQISAAQLEQYAEVIVRYLPDYLHDVSYLAHASSSMGQKPGTLSLHLEFLLSQPIQPGVLRTWIQEQNFANEKFDEQLHLTNSGMALHWVLDPVLAQNSRILFIAPPQFQGHRSDPFATPEDRWALVEKSRAAIDLIPHAARILPAAVDKKKRAKIDALRTAQGLDKFKPKTRMLMDHGRKVQVISNPDEVQMELVRVTDKYAYFNVNGGDSEAYWLKLENPEIIYNFKDEPPFEFAKAARAVYEQFMAEYGAEVIKRQEEIPMVVIDFWTDKHYKLEYDRPNDRIITDDEGRVRMAPISPGNVEAYMLDKGYPAPDPVPTWTVQFDPTDTKVMDFEGKKLNRYSAPAHLREPVPLLPQYQGIGYVVGEDNLEISALLKLLCPTTYDLLWHITGANRTDFNHFVNWLAWCIQKRRVSNTSWILSGVPGTGKGVFRDKVLFPLIGPSYCEPVRLSTLEDNFNAMIETTLFMVVDEFRLSDSKASGRTLDYIKELIGSEQGQVRAMRTDSRKVPLFLNWLFFSNHTDVMEIEDGDRRFNVATPQKVKLLDAYPDFGTRIPQLATELPTFASFLLHFDSNEHAARHPLENQARTDMKIAALNTSQQFCYAVRTGDLDFMIERIMIDTTKLTDVTLTTRINAAKKVVQNWMKSAAAGKKAQVEVDELLAVYQALNPEQTVNAAKFRTMLIRNKLQLRTTNIHGRPTSVTDVKWEAKLSDFNEMADHNLVDQATRTLFQGVTICKQPPEQPKH